MGFCVMRAGIVVTVTPNDRRRLEAVVRDRNRPQKHVWRARIILLTAEGFIEEANNKPKPFVWTADPYRIIAAVRRGRKVLESID
jgi:hypothetical protein